MQLSFAQPPHWELWNTVWLLWEFTPPCHETPWWTLQKSKKLHICNGISMDNSWISHGISMDNPYKLFVRLQHARGASETSKKHLFENISFLRGSSMPAALRRPQKNTMLTRAWPGSGELLRRTLVNNPTVLSYACFFQSSILKPPYSCNSQGPS